MVDYRGYEDSYQKFMARLGDKILEYGVKTHLEINKSCTMADLLGETIEAEDVETLLRSYMVVIEYLALIYAISVLEQEFKDEVMNLNH
jgi:hypothetical protein